MFFFCILQVNIARCKENLCKFIKRQSIGRWSEVMLWRLRIGRRSVVGDGGREPDDLVKVAGND